METSTIIGIGILVFTLVSGLGILAYYFYPRQQVDMRSLMGAGDRGDLGRPSEVRERMKNDPTGQEFERLKQQAKERAVAKRGEYTLEEKFFQAGMFSDEEKNDFYRQQKLAPIVLAPVFAFAFSNAGGLFLFVGLVFGILVGLRLPFYLLDRRIRLRGEEIMFFLPLVIEQIAIGVSSSLDVGPCLQRVVSMADERDSHNCVTELVRHAHFYVKSGASLEDALVEVGKLSGHTELKHAFMSLSQVAKHGGEITRQLQELADAVAGQRETKIESKIKKLELEATGPVAFVFIGFIIILVVGFVIQIRDAFK
jgi:pilus assembly protein TadC